MKWLNLLRMLLGGRGKKLNEREKVSHENL